MSSLSDFKPIHNCNSFRIDIWIKGTESRNRPTNMWSTDFQQLLRDFNGKALIFETNDARTTGSPTRKRREGEDRKGGKEKAGEFFI